MRFLLVALLWLITFGTVDVASAETPEELTRQCQKGDATGCVNLGRMYGQGKGVTQDDVKAVALMIACATSRYVGEYKDGIPHGEGTRTLRSAAGRW